MIAALSLDEGVSAAMTLEGAVDGIAFKVYVQEVLAPMLRPGQVVVLDNLQVHKNQAVRETIKAQGCERDCKVVPGYVNLESADASSFMPCAAQAVVRSPEASQENVVTANLAPS